MKTAEANPLSRAASRASLASLVDVLRARAQGTPERTATTFLEDGELAERRFTYAELDQQARAIGAALQDRGLLGERALLLYPPGLDYVSAFFGCLYGATIAVPTYPPDPARLEKTLPKLQAIARSARPRIALTTAELLPIVEQLLAPLPEFANVLWLATDAIPAALAERWRDPRLDESRLAFLQYTSGSTSTPKGVCVTHANLLHNLEQIGRICGVDAESHAVVWVPPYHDMGLIGGILQPIFGGFPATLLSPVHFLRRPGRWLRAISRVRGTHSAAPNFAYDLCVRKVSLEEREGLDLSSLRIALNGAEPVRAETIERFSDAFAPCGFAPESLLSVYGLAEGTLMAAAPANRRRMVTFAAEPVGLERRVATPVAMDRPHRRLVSSGRTLPDQEIRIVDPETGQPCPPRAIGEIWLSGPSVTAGYWELPEVTAATFGAQLEGKPWLRTGDLGFLDEGELYVTGRVKDLIIVRGRNLYPQDLERTVEHASPVVRPGCSCAFSVDLGEERLVLVAEVQREDAGRDLSSELDAIRAALAREHDATANVLVFVEAGALPKTSSGKLQRSATREAYFSGALQVLERLVTD
jgi:acyl-CoA synthetase (AMP-forming)/AMP-acid ligase II